MSHSSQNLTFAGQPTVFNLTTYHNPWLCTLSTCPKDYATIQYVPNLAGNAFYLAWFAVLALMQVGLGIHYHTWTYMTAMLGGSVLEMLGYIARVAMHNNIFNFNWFLMYLICLTIAPCFFTAAIYLNFSRIVLLHGQTLAHFKPRTYTYVFIACDVVALVLQAAGGALADTAAEGGSGQMGIDIMIAGLASQVTSLFAFAILCADFAWRVQKNSERSFTRSHEALRNMGSSVGRLEVLICGLAISTLAIFIRSCFRVAELHGGFGGRLANQEVTFMLLEGAMVAIAALALTVAHPGFVFKRFWQMKRAVEALGKESVEPVGS